MAKGKVGAAARAALTLAAPEVAVPLEALSGLAETALPALRGKGKASRAQPGLENVLQAPSRPFVVLRKARVRRVRGVRVYEPASGLSAGEVVAIAAVGGTAYAVYRLVKVAEGDFASMKKTLTHPWGL